MWPRLSVLTMMLILFIHLYWSIELRHCFLNRFHFAHAILDILIRNLDTIALIYPIAKVVAQEHTAYRISVSGASLPKKRLGSMELACSHSGRRACVQLSRTSSIHALPTELGDHPTVRIQLCHFRIKVHSPNCFRRSSGTMPRRAASTTGTESSNRRSLMFNSSHLVARTGCSW